MSKTERKMKKIVTNNVVYLPGYARAKKYQRGLEEYER